MPSKTLEMHNLFVKSKSRFYYTLDLSCASFGGVVYHIRPVHVVNFAIAILKTVVVQKRQSLPCKLEGQNCTK
jgi:hypothetical protein